MFLAEVRVRFGETDPFGVVYFASYLEYVKTALDEYLRSMGLSPGEFYRSADGGWPVGEVSIRYEAPARFDELLGILMWVADVARSTVRFGFRIERAGDGILLARGTITIVAIGPDWRSRRIPSALSALFRRKRVKGSKTGRFR